MGAAVALLAVTGAAILSVLFLCSCVLMSKTYAQAAATSPVKSSPTNATVSAPAPCCNDSTSSFASRVFAPYLPLDMVNYSFDLAGGPCKFYTLAFVLADTNKQPSWNGQQQLAVPAVRSAIDKLRAKGGDVIVSCGGASGSELGTVISDAKQLQAAYQKVIDAYKVRWLDLDIEGGPVGDTASVDTRNKAIAALQKANPGLLVSYTLSADTNGVNWPSVALLQNAKKNGVNVHSVNGMLMEMNQNNADNIIKGAKAIKSQIAQAGLPGAKVGICVMIGVNDSGGPCSLADARAVAAFAKKTPWVNWTSFWSVARDNGNCAGKTQADGSCSGLAQAKYAFCAAFR